MDKNEINQKLNDYARNSKDIAYTINIFDKKNQETNKKPKIVLREVIEGRGNVERHVWAIILKYEIDEIPQEVIIGTIGDTEERKEQAIEIISLIRKQFEENTIPGSGYNYFKELNSYIQTQKIPFRFTSEGIGVLGEKNKKTTSYFRTYSSDEKGKIRCMYNEKAVREIVYERTKKILDDDVQIAEEKKWKERREKILKSFKTQEKTGDFLKGERINQFIQETDDDIKKQKDLVIDYLKDTGREQTQEEKENPKSQLLNGYLQLKEKGISIDAKIILETLEDKYYGKIKETGGKVSPEDIACLDLIKEHEKFFDLVKEGRDWSARLNYFLKLKDFSFLRKVFEASKDDELLEYLNIKEKMIKDVKLTEIEVDSAKYDSVKEFDEFILNSKIRKMTRGKEVNFISQIYDHIKRVMIETNYDSVELYNKYAEKSGRDICSLPVKRQPSNERYISDLVDKICREYQEKEENEDTKSYNGEEQEGR